MTYASQSDLTERFGVDELAQRSNRLDGSAIDAGVVARALADADAEIDSYLATRYALPLASTPTVINRLACDIARYRLYDDGVTEAVRQRFEDALALLKKFSSGEVRLAGFEDVATAGTAMVHHSFEPRQMSADNLRGFA
ncbi:DUF1320 domain-containing protein [Rhodoferax sp.]|uniref:gp436 family protein n=1 Tax=Rhodoferax sp. TaxID=50421 RepID=UPI0026326165|nr:DUF1320 domain-containing protein [Rhodoferax sp.]MDD5479651.1 DUF1320 domain-containing protein [Rhodoferax sp.]